MSDSSYIKPFVPSSSPSQDSELDTEPPQLPIATKVIQSPFSPTWSLYSGWNVPITPMTPWSTSSGSSSGSPWSPFSPTIFHPPQAIMSIHRHLCRNITHPDSPPELLWDIIHPPDFARVRDLRFSHFWEKPDLDADSVQPFVKKVWIDCDHGVLSYWFQKWGHINVASDRVTVRQILEGIYNYLRTPLTEDDLRELYTLPGNDEGLRIARAKRAKDSYEIDAVVLASGFRRVDIAGSHRRFQGMRIVAYPDHTWRLHFNLLPGSVPRQY